jgi:hypothetical protein
MAERRLANCSQSHLHPTSVAIATGFIDQLAGNQRYAIGLANSTQLINAETMRDLTNAAIADRLNSCV